jgi:hypothetical protein
MQEPGKPGEPDKSLRPETVNRHLQAARGILNPRLAHEVEPTNTGVFICSQNRTGPGSSNRPHVWLKPSEMQARICSAFRASLAPSTARLDAYANG